ncbi:aminotransferase class IV [Desulfitibacter alkalitolerans]|uniref:aminotransferase class IV n=1 Tax=Desulfitibacter alkalitolerans TaxID=264641 RepID=UPI000481A5EF|nr:aminotransferase class IV [Desulfitibacter alkalitolerans]
MQDLAYVNGVISDVKDAFVHIEDRGFQFGEGVYEVIKVYNGKPFVLIPHLERLKRSSVGMGIDFPWEIEFLEKEVLRLLAETGLDFANIYMQVSPGSAPRSHLLDKDPTPSLVMTIRKAAETGMLKEIKLIAVEDIRWKKCWIKSTNLAANIMGKKIARQQGAGEIIMYEADGTVTEGGSSNIFAVRSGVLATPDLECNILAGITRKIVLEIARDRKLEFKEGKISLDELKLADEIFITSTTFEITAVTRLDGITIGNGTPGPITKSIHADYMAMIKKHCY